MTENLLKNRKENTDFESEEGKQELTTTEEQISDLESPESARERKYKEQVEIAYQKSMLRFGHMIAERNKLKAKVAAEKTPPKSSENKSNSEPVKISSLEEEKEAVAKSSFISRIKNSFRVKINEIKGIKNPEDVVALQEFIESPVYYQSDVYKRESRKLDRESVAKLPELIGKTNDPITTITRLERMGFGFHPDTFRYRDFDSLLYFADSDGAIDALEKMKESGFTIPASLGRSSFAEDVNAVDLAKVLVGDKEDLDFAEKNKETLEKFFAETGIKLYPSPESLKIMKKLLEDATAMDFCKKFNGNFVTYSFERNNAILERILSLKDKSVLEDIIKLDSFSDTQSLVNRIFDGFYEGSTEEDLTAKVKKMEIILKDQESISYLEKISEIVGEKLYIEGMVENVRIISDIKPYWKEVFAYFSIMEEVNLLQIYMDNRYSVLEGLKTIAERMKDNDFKQFIFDPFAKKFRDAFEGTTSFNFKTEWQDVFFLYKNYKQDMELVLTPKVVEIAGLFKGENFFHNYPKYIELAKIDNCAEILEKMKTIFGYTISDPRTILELSESGVLDQLEKFLEIKKLFGERPLSYNDYYLYIHLIKMPGALEFVDRMIKYSDRVLTIETFQNLTPDIIALPVEKAMEIFLVNDFNSRRFGFLESKQYRDIFFEKKLADFGKIEENQERETKLSKIKRIEQSFSVKENPEDLSPRVKEKVELFRDKYGPKGETLMALAIVAYGLDDEDAFIEKMAKIEKVLDLYSRDNIPSGTKVSFGIEYEVGHSLATEYSKISAFGYNGDIELVNRSAGISSGGDGVHEIAIRPTDNPYILIAEVKLLQDGGFLDFNFEKYPSAARGYHLNLGGEGGLAADSSACFLHNAMTMASLTGINAGREVLRAKYPVSNSLDKYFAQTRGERVEIKGMATDSFEQFERSILTSYHAGIAIQLFNKYTGYSKYTRQSELFNNEFIDQLPDYEEELDGFLKERKMLAEPFSSNQERQILFEWLQLEKQITNALREHNESFGDSEFNGYVVLPDGEFVDTAEHIDIARNKKLLGNLDADSDEFRERFKINENLLFQGQQTDFVNGLVRVNNLFLKAPTGKRKTQLDNSSVNAASMLSVMKNEGYKISDDSGTPQQSIFDRDGKMREGYYYVQGASEEMITHKSQILLNNFNKRMEELLKDNKDSITNNSAKTKNYAV